MVGLEAETNNDENKPSVKNLRKSEKLSSWFIDYFLKYFFAKDLKVDPFDSIILKAHYNFTSHLLLTIFVFVTSHWFVEEPIICIDKSDKSRAPEDLLDICLTYPYVEFPVNNDRNRIVRRYALHYKWVHIACLLISFIYKGVVLAQKIFAFKNHKEMLQKLCEANLKDRFWIAKRYFTNYKGCHKHMYTRFLYVHLSALCINILSFFALNITFQSRYWDLPKHLLMKRDPTFFYDQFSLIFPPFVKCEITSVHHILVGRTKWFGCHLPLMEIYEKVFMMFWFWQTFLALWTCLFILYNIPLSFCYKWKLNLLNCSSFNHYDPYKTCAKNFGTDDIFALKSITTLILGGDYIRLLSSLSGISKENEDPVDPNDTLYYDHESHSKNSILSDMPVNSSSFHSCNQEGSKNDLPAIGFKSFALSPEPPTDFNPVTSSSMISNPVQDTPPLPYSAWKRSFSLEFDMCPLKRSMDFDAKICPLMQYLRRDDGISHPASTSVLNQPFPSAPQEDDDNTRGMYLEDSGKFFQGGEKNFHSESDWENDQTCDNGKNCQTEEIFISPASDGNANDWPYTDDGNNNWRSTSDNDTNCPADVGNDDFWPVDHQNWSENAGIETGWKLNRNERQNYTTVEDANMPAEENWDEENWG